MTRLSLPRSNLLGRLAASVWPLPLRFIVGCGFVEHGWAKLARGPDAFPKILHDMGLPAPHLLAWSTIFVEIVGGLSVLLGIMIPLASIPMIVVLLVAALTVHLPFGFSSIKLQSVDAAGAHFGPPGYETDALYVAALVALVMGGTGPLSVETLLPWRLWATKAHLNRKVRRT